MQKMDIDWYFKYDQSEQGDINWVIPGKVLAMSGPIDNGH